MKRLLGAIFILLVLSTPVRAAFLEPFPDGTASEPPVIEIHLSELPEVWLTPDSPLYFLKTLWEGAWLLVEHAPKDKALLVLAYAGERLAEIIKMIGKGVNFAVIERAFKERHKLLEVASRLAGGEGEVKLGILRQITLGDGVAESLPEVAAPEDESRVQNLIDWREGWLVDFEEVLGELQASPSGVVGEPPSEGLSGVDFDPESVSESFLEKVFNFVFGSGEGLLSPLAVPGEGS